MGNEDSLGWRVTPRDILTSAATLTGLVLTAVGLSAMLSSLSTVLQTLSLALVLVVVLFVSAACFTCLASLVGNYSVFRVAMVVYLGGWIFTGVFLCLLLLGNAWGIQIFQIHVPNMPRLDVQTLLSAGFSLISTAVAWLVYRRTRIDTKQLRILIERLDVNRIKADAIAEKALTRSEDRRIALLELYERLQAILRKMVEGTTMRKDSHRMTMGQLSGVLFDQGKIDRNVVDAIRYVARIRDTVAHVGMISDREAIAALDLIAYLLERLSALSSRNLTERG